MQATTSNRQVELTPLEKLEILKFREHYRKWRELGETFNKYNHDNNDQNNNIPSSSPKISFNFSNSSLRKRIPRSNNPDVLLASIGVFNFQSDISAPAYI